MSQPTTPVWKWQGRSRWHLLATDPERDETYVLATATDTHWHVPGTHLDGAAHNAKDARLRAISTLLRLGMLPDLPEEPAEGTMTG